MTVDELISLDPRFGPADEAAYLLNLKIPTWSTSIFSHKLGCKHLSEIRIGELSIQEFQELEDMYCKFNAYFKKIEKETEIRKAAAKYDC